MKERGGAWGLDGSQGNRDNEFRHREVDLGRGQQVDLLCLNGQVYPLLCVISVCDTVSSSSVNTPTCTYWHTEAKTDSITSLMYTLVQSRVN